MFRENLSACMLCALMLLPAAVAAQEEEAPRPFVYATYFECDTSREALADALFERHMAPHYDAAVADGAMMSWGYMAHHTGGKWRRLVYRAAPTLSQAIASVEAVAEKVQQKDAAANAAFGAICNSHVDYIWQSITGSGGGSVGQERGEVGFSAYYVCDETRETEADDLVKETLGPLYDKQVAAGNLATWGWMQHWVGGKYRRILTMTSKDVDSLMAARDGVVQALIDNEEVGNKFSGICGSHSDYLWEIRLETP